jgi:hypothetical protein
MTSQGTPHGRFQCAIQRRHLNAAEMVARERWADSHSRTRSLFVTCWPSCFPPRSSAQPCTGFNDSSRNDGLRSRKSRCSISTHRDPARQPRNRSSDDGVPRQRRRTPPQLEHRQAAPQGDRAQESTGQGRPTSSAPSTRSGTPTAIAMENGSNLKWLRSLPEPTCCALPNRRAQMG